MLITSFSDTIKKKLKVRINRVIMVNILILPHI